MLKIHCDRVVESEQLTLASITGMCLSQGFSEENILMVVLVWFYVTCGETCLVTFLIPSPNCFPLSVLSRSPFALGPYSLTDSTAVPQEEHCGPETPGFKV